MVGVDDGVGVFIAVGVGVFDGTADFVGVVIGLGVTVVGGATKLPGDIEATDSVVLGTITVVSVIVAVGSGVGDRVLGRRVTKKNSVSTASIPTTA